MTNEPEPRPTGRSLPADWMIIDDPVARTEAADVYDLIGRQLADDVEEVQRAVLSTARPGPH